MWATLEPDAIPRLPAAVRNGAAPAGAALPGRENAAEADAWKECIDALLAIRLLDDDWDGQGSPATGGGTGR